MTRSLSTLRPTVNGVWSRLIVRWSFPCTKTRVGKIPDPGDETGPVMG